MTTFAGLKKVDEPVPASSADLMLIAPLAVSPKGDLYFGDAFLHKIFRIDNSNGMMGTFAGNGIPGSGGDNGPPAEAELHHPSAVLIDGNKFIYIVDYEANRVRRITVGSDPIRIETFAGNGVFGRASDGKRATETRLSDPAGIAKHPQTGEVYISNSQLPSILRVTRNGIISTVAGTGQTGFAGDGGPGVKAQFKKPTFMVFDSKGNLYISDQEDHRIRVIAPNGLISTFAGNGRSGFAGDGGPAKDAELNGPLGLTCDSEGNLYIADTGNHRVRKIEAQPPHLITTVAGNGSPGFSGDGGLATQAQLNRPRGITLTSDGMLYITDGFNRCIRAVRLQR